MQEDILQKLQKIKDHTTEAKRLLNELAPEDLDVAGGLAAAEESLKYAESQLDNALRVISNIC